MSFKHGSNAELWLAGADVSTYFNQLDFAAEVDTAEVTTFKQTWKRHLPGQVAATFDTGGFYDPDFTDLLDILTVASGTVLTAASAGMDAIGDLCRLATIRATSYGESAPIGGAVAFTWGVLTDGEVGFGEVLKPMAAVTTTASGSTLTGPVGGSSDGAIAHLHVTSVSAGDSLDVTLAHSTNGTTWTDLDTFTTVTAAGAERIEIAGTVNRYLRASYTVTGTDPSITFGVALARL